MTEDEAAGGARRGDIPGQSRYGAATGRGQDHGRCQRSSEGIPCPLQREIRRPRTAAEGCLPPVEAKMQPMKRASFRSDEPQLGKMPGGLDGHFRWTSARWREKSNHEVWPIGEAIKQLTVSGALGNVDLPTPSSSVYSETANVGGLAVCKGRVDREALGE